MSVDVVDEAILVGVEVTIGVASRSRGGDSNATKGNSQDEDLEVVHSPGTLKKTRCGVGGLGVSKKRRAR